MGSSPTISSLLPTGAWTDPGPAPRSVAISFLKGSFYSPVCDNPALPVTTLAFCHCPHTCRVADVGLGFAKLFSWYFLHEPFWKDNCNGNIFSCQRFPDSKLESSELVFKLFPIFKDLKWTYQKKRKKGMPNKDTKKPASSCGHLQLNKWRMWIFWALLKRSESIHLLTLTLSSPHFVFKTIVLLLVVPSQPTISALK